MSKSNPRAIKQQRLTFLTLATLGTVACQQSVSSVTVELQPSNPYSFHDIEVVVIEPAMGPDGPLNDVENDYNYTWYRDGERVANVGGPVLDSIELTDGQTWEVAVTPVYRDRKGTAAVATATVNTRPTASVSFDAASSDSSSDLVARVQVNDVDPQDPVPLFDITWEYMETTGQIIQWSNSSSSSTVVPADQLEAGQRWTATVTPYTPLPADDRFERAEGDSVSAQIDIVTALPVSTKPLVVASGNSDADNNSSTAATGDSLFCSYSLVTHPIARIHNSMPTLFGSEMGLSKTQVTTSRRALSVTMKSFVESRPYAMANRVFQNSQMYSSSEMRRQWSFQSLHRDSMMPMAMVIPQPCQ